MPSPRRSFLGSAVAAGGLLLARPFAAFAAQGSYRKDAGYGPLTPARDETTGRELLALPRGFRYWSLGAAGSPLVDGSPTPPAHDGMAAFGHGKQIRIVRNHEVTGRGRAFGPLERAYDPEAPGGTTTLVFEPSDPVRSRAFPSLSGTSTNCAGGPTPWGSWLSCEEVLSETRSQGLTFRHGYVFEVPSGAEEAAIALPLKGLGRFVHEAVAVDPGTGIVYETEDEDRAAFYRFVPSRTGELTAGCLQALAVKGIPRCDTSRGRVVGRAVEVEWVEIAAPDPGPGEATCYGQAARGGGASFRRLEGAWWSPQDRAVYFTATEGGEAQSGQIWAHRPGSAGGTLTLVYESPAPDALMKPDNVTVSPTGGILLCEDTDRERPGHLRGLTPEGVLYTFADNISPGSLPGSTIPALLDEFAGACFSPDGRWLFVNLQASGLTFAITGPWEKGPLGVRS
jgi:secreted PhoX family phosphatase